MTARPLLFCTTDYADLAARVREAGNLATGEVEHDTFPDGERYLRLLGDTDGADAIVLGGTISDAATLELYDLACGAVAGGARTLTLVIPYFGYSTMERAALPGEVVTAKTRARLFSAVPHAAAGNRVVLLDLHAEGIPHYFEEGTLPVHLYAKSIVRDWAVKLAGGQDFVLACTDAGRAKWVESLANDLDVTAAFVFKRRLDGASTRITAVSAHVAGRTVIIYDDMIRTGGSLLQAAQAYRDAGAARIAAIATHGVLPGDALARLRGSGLLEAVVTTDSHPRARALADDFLTVESVGPLLASYLRGSP